MLRACGNIVGFTGFVDVCVPLYRQMESSAYNDAPLSAVRVRRYFEIVFSPKEHRLSVRARHQTSIEARERSIHFGQSLYPCGVRIHRSPFP